MSYVKSVFRFPDPLPKEQQNVSCGHIAEKSIQATIDILSFTVSMIIPTLLG